MFPKPLPRYLFWCDLETSGLDPKRDQILELALPDHEIRVPVRGGVRSFVDLIFGIAPSSLVRVTGRCGRRQLSPVIFA